LNRRISATRAAEPARLPALQIGVKSNRPRGDLQVATAAASKGPQVPERWVMSRLFGAAALVVAACPALAAEVPRNGPPVSPIAAPIADRWSGPYVGLNLGHTWSHSDVGAAPHGLAGGIQAGYAWQHGQLVLGAEADLQGSRADDMFANYKFANPWFGTLRGRFGYAFSSLLIYGTFGLAAGGGRLRIAGLSETETHFGWSGGGGIEVGLTPNWSTKAEYVFIGLDNKTYVLSGASVGLDAHHVRLGVNYRF
jgi:outer membrane immunogenic protein